MQGPSTCNVIAFDNVQLDWLSSQITVDYWAQSYQNFSKDDCKRRKAAIDAFEKKKANQRKSKFKGEKA